MITLLLVQDKTNPSVLLLAKALANQHQKVCIFDIKNTSFCTKQGITYLQEGATHIRLEDLVLVMKRTWGPIRHAGLKICKALQKEGVPVVNGCDLIEWTHSKIRQYRSIHAQKKSLFPTTVCFSPEELKALALKSSEQSLLYTLCQEATLLLNFPMILKKDKGCRADGVYRIDSLDALKRLMIKEWDSLKEGFLLQSYIPSHPINEISQYYRLNIVDGKVQSAVQFQLQWGQTKPDHAAPLNEFKDAKEMPVSLDLFLAQDLKDILSACPYQQEVIGVDVMLDQKGKLYLLEYNDGPSVAAIVDIGLQDPTLEGAQACFGFAHSIGAFCAKKIHTLQCKALLTPYLHQTLPEAKEATKASTLRFSRL